MAAVNDSTKQKIGDLYQYFMALLDCFSMKTGESMLIETKGDVSIISSVGQNPFQKEIKHHFGKSTISDRSVDFWNTLDNWCKERNEMATFKKLVFCTTSKITPQSIFSDWNTKTPSEKYDILKKCGEEKKGHEKNFRAHYNSVFSSDELTRNDIIVILEKIEIWSNQKIISEIDQLFAGVTRHIPYSNKRKYIELLLGQILGKVVDPPHRWKVTQEEFDQMVVDATALFAKSPQVYLHTLNSDAIPPQEDIQSISSKVFVKEIERIEYDEVIPDAIVDYWRTHIQVIQNAQGNMMFMASLPEYRNDLLIKLSSEKRQAKRKVLGLDHLQHINEAQAMYDRAIGWHAHDFGHIVGNASYFQHGIIHGLVDAKSFEWSLEVDDEH